MAEQSAGRTVRTLNHNILPFDHSFPEPQRIFAGRGEQPIYNDLKERINSKVNRYWEAVIKDISDCMRHALVHIEVCVAVC